MHRQRTTLGALGLTMLLVAACGSTATPATPAASSSTGTAPSASSSPDASAVIADLETKAKAEGVSVVFDFSV